MNKTSTHIQVVKVASDTIIVRPPATMKVFRATIYLQNIEGNDGIGLLSTVAEQNQQNVIIFSNATSSTNNVIPNDNQTIGFINKLVLDRRGVGYMAESFYVAGKGLGTSFVFIFEGITQS